MVLGVINYQGFNLLTVGTALYHDCKAEVKASASQSVDLDSISLSSHIEDF